MGQQPNIEHSRANLPRTELAPPPPQRWRPEKPGLIVSPADLPQGGTFGTTGPDPGWALRLLSLATLPDDDPRLRGLLSGLMVARAAALGRGPTMEDLEAALVLCGYGFEASAEVMESRERWLAAVPHETRPGESAIAEVDRDLLEAKPEQIRWALGHGGRKTAPKPS